MKRIPIYEPLQVFLNEKCGKVIAEPKELIKTFSQPVTDSEIGETSSKV